MRVIRAHLKQRHVSVGVAQDFVKRLAHGHALGSVSPEDERLAAALTKATQCSVAELAVLSEDWPV